MNAISQTQAQRTPFGTWNTGRPQADRLTDLIRRAGERLEEAYATVVGVFAMPLQHGLDDECLDRLDDHLLRDIGYERVKGPRLDSHLF